MEQQRWSNPVVCETLSKHFTWNLGKTSLEGFCLHYTEKSIVCILGIEHIEKKDVLPHKTFTKLFFDRHRATLTIICVCVHLMNVSAVSNCVCALFVANQVVDSFLLQ